MAKPNSRQTFIDYCLRSLGAPVIVSPTWKLPATEPVNVKDELVTLCFK